MSPYREEFEVRDSELDMQGRVNNANYLKYFEHARHKHMHTMNISFSKLAEAKQYVLLISSHLEFKHPLKANDKFYVTSKLVQESKIRFAFEQEIHLLADDTLVATAHNICVCVDGNNNNKPYLPEFIRLKL